MTVEQFIQSVCTTLGTMLEDATHAERILAKQHKHLFSGAYTAGFLLPSISSDFVLKVNPSDNIQEQVDYIETVPSEYKPIFAMPTKIAPSFYVQERLNTLHDADAPAEWIVYFNVDGKKLKTIDISMHLGISDIGGGFNCGWNERLQAYQIYDFNIPYNPNKRKLPY